MCVCVKCLCAYLCARVHVRTSLNLRVSVCKKCVHIYERACQAEQLHINRKAAAKQKRTAHARDKYAYVDALKPSAFC